MKIKFGLFAGRFQPLHKDHLKRMLKILKEVEYLVVGIVNPDPVDTIKFKEFVPKKNPFTYWERYRMIHDSLKEAKVDMRRVYIVPFYPPSLYGNKKTDRFVLKKDVVIYYPVKDEFDKWKIRDAKKRKWKVKTLKVTQPIEATEVRKRIINNGNWEELVPKATAQIIKEIKGVERIKKLTKAKK